MLVRYVSETEIEPYQGFIEENGMVYTNKHALEKAPSHGFKELVSDDCPEVNETSQYTEEFYVVEENNIRLKYAIKTRPIIKIPMITLHTENAYEDVNKEYLMEEEFKYCHFLHVPGLDENYMLAMSTLYFADYFPNGIFYAFNKCIKDHLIFYTNEAIKYDIILTNLRIIHKDADTDGGRLLL